MARRSRTWSAYDLHTTVPAERWGILETLYELLEPSRAGLYDIVYGSYMLVYANA